MDNKWKREFPKKLESLLEARDMTQRQLAEEIGATEASISRYANGQRIPKITTTARIAKALNVNVYDLIDFIYDGETKSHSESEILKGCIALMQELVDDFARWYEWTHGDDAISELDEEEMFCVRKTYFEIVKRLFLWNTHHSGGNSTRTKCSELGIDDWSEDIEFGFEVEEDDG